MRFEKRSRLFDLKPTSIDEASEWLVNCLEGAGVEKSDRLRTRLLFEEALINMADRFEEEREVSAYLERHNGRIRLRIVVKGERFNPLRPEIEGSPDDWSTSLFSLIDMHVQYAYSMGSNVLRMSLPRQSWNPVLKLCIALIAGAVIGFLGGELIPDTVEVTFSNAVLQPIADMWMRLLQAISGPIIFLTALTAAWGTKRIADFGGSRITTVARYFGISLIVTIVAMLCCWPFFPKEVSATIANKEFLTTALDTILKIVPGNLIDPFSEANTPQLLLIAIATGYILATMESKIGELKTIIQQLNLLGLTVAKYACTLVPFFVGLMLCLKIWTNDTALLGAIWLPLALSAVLSGAIVLVTLLVASASFRVNPLLLTKKLKKPFFDALKRGTLDFSTVDDLADSCKRLLGINGEFAQAVLPQGLFLYMPTSTIGICVFVMFAAHTQQIPVDQAWLLAAIMLSVVLAVATPPMTGANLLSFVMAFSYLGISNDALLDVMVFDLIFGVLCIGFDQAMLQLETISQAQHMGFLNEKTLRAPLSESK